MVRIAALWVILPAVLLASFISVTGHVPQASACTLVEPKTGDLNSDGLTNSLDALSVLFYSAGLMKAPSDIWMAGADVDCNSSVNAVDATLILEADAGLYQIRP
jgi:hypothetical protein